MPSRKPADDLQELVHLVVLTAHGGADLAVRVGYAYCLEQDRRIKGRKRRLLHPVVRHHLHGAGHLGRARNEHMPLLCYANVKIARRRHKVEIAGASLGDYLLKAFGGAVHVEIPGADLPLVRHLGLIALFAADLHWTERYLEHLAVAAHGLDELHEPVAKRTGANLLL